MSEAPTATADDASVQERRDLVWGLQRLADRDDRGALAALRRGLGKEPGTVAAMFPYVETWLSPNAPRSQVEAAYVVASLFGMHPHHRDGPGEPYERWRNGLGAALAPLRRRPDSAEEDQGLERRFMALLDADRDALPTHLRQVISLLRSRDPERPINYRQLLYDIHDWDVPERWVQRNWAAGFWGSDATDQDHANTDGTGEQDN